MAGERAAGTPSAHDLTIFISYRRSDTRADAGRLYDSLRRRFGKDQLFMDVDTLLPGQDWVNAVESAVARCDVLLALIGDEWSTVVDASGKRRIEDDLDRVRLEIEAALKQDKPVIPVLFEDASMPGAGELPETLQSLRRRHAMRLAHDTFRYDLEPLIHALRNIETAKRERLGLPPRAERPVVAPRRVEPTAVDKPPSPAPAPIPPAYPPAAPTYPPAPPTPPTYAQSAPSWTYQQPQYLQPTAYAQQPQSYPPQNQWQQPGWPAKPKAGAGGNPLSIVAIVLGAIALLLFPIIFGPAGIIVGVIAKSRRETWATGAIIFAIVAMFVGFMLGALVALGS